MSYNAFNNQIGSPLDLAHSRLNENQRANILAGLFEQLLLFDQITIPVNRTGFSLNFLIETLGINLVETLIERGFLRFLLWTPQLLICVGNQSQDGRIDESRIYELPPIQSATLTSQDQDPEFIIRQALSTTNIVRERRRIFRGIALRAFTVPEGLHFSQKSAELVIDAYTNNNLADLGLPYDKEPKFLDLPSRQKLLGIGISVLETAILAQYNLKSFDNYDHLKICQSNLDNIGSALKVSKNSSEILQLENIPDLKQLYLSERLDFESVISLRYGSAAKYFRQWLNEKSENEDALPITKEYVNEIKGKNKFFETSEGKFVRTIGMFGVSTALGAVIMGSRGLFAGLGLGFLENYWLDSIFKGNNASMFITDLENFINKDQT